jgi:ribosomal protein S12 methylthiotransferase
MNRRGNGETIRQVIAKLRREIPEIVIRTTFIVGFPGETEEDFRELCEFVHETRFERAGVFTYSREEGTPAYNFKDQIDEQVKLDRMDMIMSDQMDIAASINEEKIGKTLTVIYEGFDQLNKTHFGRSEADAPDIDGKVYFKVRKKQSFEPGDFVKVKITDIIDYDLFGTAE